MQFHEIKLNFEFRPLNQCVITTSNVSVSSHLSALRLTDASLFVDFVYLDREERQKFAASQHEYLIEQLQFTGQESVSAVSQKIRLNYNHPCKALYWAVQLGRYTTGKSFLAYNPRDFEAARVLATKRFVLACASYSSDTVNTCTVDASNNLVVSRSGLAIGPKTIFDQINAACVVTTADVDSLTILGRLLTIEEFSTPVSVLLSGVTRPANGDGAAASDVVVYQWDNFGTYLNRTGNPVQRALLQLNGHDRFSERDGSYFNYVQPYQHHSNTPADGVNMYSFALNPEEHQPSGSCNMSRIDNATLNLTFGDGKTSAAAFKSDYLADDSKLSVWATNYNVLRIMSGMGGLAYSN